LEPIQEAPSHNTLVKSSERPEPDSIENLGYEILTSSIEQPDIQRTDVQMPLLISFGVLPTKPIFELNNQLRYDLY
jgi:hypothetical protein